MRKIPGRGEKYHLFPHLVLVTTLEVKGKSVQIIMPNGKITIVTKDDLDLPTIDTNFYEKLT